MPKTPARKRADVASPVDDAPHALPPTKQEWLLLAGSIIFVAIGLVLLRSSPDVAIVTLAFSGTCLVTTIAFQWRRHLDSIFRVRTVDVVGGVRIRPQKRMIYFIGAWLTFLGAVMYLHSAPYPWLFAWLCLLIAAFGVGFLLAAAFGYLPVGYLQFDPDALMIGETRWAVQTPWENISAVYQGEYHMNPVVWIQIADDDAVTITPPIMRTKAMKKMNFNRAMLGGPFMLMPMHYGIATPALAGAITRYCKDAKARANLQTKPTLTPPAA